jgi:hypothetical protein
LEHANHKGMIGGQSRKPLDLAWEIWRPNCNAKCPTPNVRLTKSPPPPVRYIPTQTEYSQIADGRHPPEPLRHTQQYFRYQHGEARTHAVSNTPLGAQGSHSAAFSTDVSVARLGGGLREGNESDEYRTDVSVSVRSRRRESVQANERELAAPNGALMS